MSKHFSLYKQEDIIDAYLSNTVNKGPIKPSNPSNSNPSRPLSANSHSSKGRVKRSNSHNVNKIPVYNEIDNYNNLVFQLSREDLVSEVQELKKKNLSLETYINQLRIANTKYEKEIKYLHNQLDIVTQNPTSQINHNLLKDKDNTVTRLLKKQIHELKEQLYVKDNQIDSIKKSVNSSNYLVISYERDEYQAEVYRLQKIVRDLKDYINIQKQRQNWINVQTNPQVPIKQVPIPYENELKKEIEQLKEGYNNILNNLQNPIKLSKKNIISKSINDPSVNDGITKVEQIIEKKIRSTSARRRRKLMLLKQAAINNRQTDSEQENEDNASAKSSALTKPRKVNVNITADTISSKIKKVEKPTEKLDLLNDKLKDLSKLEGNNIDRKTPKAEKPTEKAFEKPLENKINPTDNIKLDNQIENSKNNVNNTIISDKSFDDNTSKIIVIDKVDNKTQSQLEDLSDYEVITTPQIDITTNHKPIVHENIQPEILLPKYEIDQAIEAMYYNGDTWYPGIIKTCYIITDNKYVYDILYDDGDKELKVPEDRIRLRKIIENDSIKVITSTEVYTVNNEETKQIVDNSKHNESHHSENKSIKFLDVDKSTTEEDNFPITSSAEEDKFPMTPPTNNESIIEGQSLVNKGIDDTLSGYLNNLSDDEDYSIDDIGSKKPNNNTTVSTKKNIDTDVNMLDSDMNESPQIIRRISKLLDSKVANIVDDIVVQDIAADSNTNVDIKIDDIDDFDDRLDKQLENIIKKGNSMSITKNVNIGNEEHIKDIPVTEEKIKKKSNTSSKKSIDPYEDDGYEDDFD